MHTLAWRHAEEPELRIAGDLIEQLRAGRVNRHVGRPPVAVLAGEHGCTGADVMHAMRFLVTCGFLAEDEEDAFHVPDDDATGDGL